MIHSRLTFMFLSESSSKSKSIHPFSFTELEVAGVLGAIQGVPGVGLHPGPRQFTAHAHTCRQFRVAH